MTRIRIATVGDYALLPEIEADAGQVFRGFDLPAIAEMPSVPHDYYLTLPPSSVVFVACDDADCPVGFAIGLMVDGQAYLRELSVKRAFARQGIGRSLVEKIIVWAKAGRYRDLTLTTVRDLPFNGPFYAKMGFVEFEPDQNWPQLHQIREDEKRNGMEILPRIAMRLALADR